jgi:hypothetical protein
MAAGDTNVGFTPDTAEAEGSQCTVDGPASANASRGTRVQCRPGMDVVEAQREVLARDLDAPVIGWHEHETPIVFAEMVPRSPRPRVDHDVLFKAREPGVLDRCNDEIFARVVGRDNLDDDQTTPRKRRGSGSLARPPAASYQRGIPS